MRLKGFSHCLICDCDLFLLLMGDVFALNPVKPFFAIRKFAFAVTPCERGQVNRLAIRSCSCSAIAIACFVATDELYEGSFALCVFCWLRLGFFLSQQMSCTRLTGSFTRCNCKNITNSYVAHYKNKIYKLQSQSEKIAQCERALSYVQQ